MQFQGLRVEMAERQRLEGEPAAELRLAGPDA